MESPHLHVEKSSVEKRKDAEFRLLLKLRTQNIPESIVKSIISDVRDIVRYSVEDHVSSEKLSECTEVFTGLETRWKQDQLIGQNENFIQPRKILLDSRFKKVSQPSFDGNRKIVKCQDSFFYISIIDIILDFFKNPENRKLLTQKRSDHPNILRSFLDGELAKRNELFKQHPNCLQIHIYYDEINLVDTASANPVKMAMFYFMIANMSPAL
ncbi:hypothetical protein QAD02_018382 [Eretmocerus hayati]|uniref:Uncharacterized protein n=1 Tax=Eretmocerus hayati TaxID=131215 RepID=A0ACC2PLD2_9HYME|nr:hypothetical protein QAD02_018382 [Eretmocerus hayati]